MMTVLTPFKTHTPNNTSDQSIIPSGLSIGMAHRKGGTLITTQMVLFVSEMLTITPSESKCIKTDPSIRPINKSSVDLGRDSIWLKLSKAQTKIKEHSTDSEISIGTNTWLLLVALPQAKTILSWQSSAMMMVLTQFKTQVPHNTSDQNIILSGL